MIGYDTIAFETIPERFRRLGDVLNLEAISTDSTRNRDTQYIYGRVVGPTATCKRGGRGFGRRVGALPSWSCAKKDAIGVFVLAARTLLLGTSDSSDTQEYVLVRYRSCLSGSLLVTVMIWVDVSAHNGTANMCLQRTLEGRFHSGLADLGVISTSFDGRPDPGLTCLHSKNRIKWSDETR